MTEESSANHLEQNILSRVRSWRDLFPWLAVTDALRPVTTLAAITLISGATAASLGLEILFENIETHTQTSNQPVLVTSDEAIWRLLESPANAPQTTGPNKISDWLFAPLAICIEAIHLVYGPTLKLLGQNAKEVNLANILLLGAHQLLTLIVWMIPAGFVIRQSGLSIGGRTFLSTFHTTRLIASRSLGFLGVAFIPGLISLAAVCYFAITAEAYQIPVLGSYIGLILDIMGIPIALAGGLLGFAALLAVPLGWAAVSLERDGSSFDAISRGYEYTLRRPLQWSCYLILGSGLAYILVAIAQGVTHVALVIVSHTQAILASSPIGNRIIVVLLQFVPMVIALAVGWALVAWLYLLLRHSTNNQEIEDLWEQPRPTPTPLPKLDIPSQ